MFLGIIDLYERWGKGAGEYTRPGIRYLTHAHDFPAPHHTVNCGQTPVWRLADIQDFEDDHPEVLDKRKKRAKVASFLRCKQKG